MLLYFEPIISCWFLEYKYKRDQKNQSKNSDKAMFEQTLVENRGFLIALCVPLIGAYFAVYVYNRNRFNAASNKFRSIVLAELQGIYPVNGFWMPEEYPRIQKSIPIIKKAALEFRPAIPFYSKRRFNKAVLEYCEQSQNIKWDTAVTDAVLSDTINETQKEKFVYCVSHLLSFTK
jgi:hypothetical protein